MKHIVSEYFQEKAARGRYPNKPSRLLEILTSGKVVSCVNCGAFTQTTKKKKRRSKVPWDKSCHKCGSALFDLNAFTKFAAVPTKWLYATYTKHTVNKRDQWCEALDGRKDLFFPVEASNDLKNQVLELDKAVLLNLGIKEDELQDSRYCKHCKASILRWIFHVEGTLLEMLQAKEFRIEQLMGKAPIRVVSYENRAAAENVAVEELVKPKGPVTKKKRQVRPVAPPVPVRPVVARQARALVNAFAQQVAFNREFIRAFNIPLDGARLDGAPFEFEQNAPDEEND